MMQNYSQIVQALTSRPRPGQSWFRQGNGDPRQTIKTRQTVAPETQGRMFGVGRGSRYVLR